LLEEEWKKYLANRALDILEASISQQSVEIFRSLLKGENEEELAKRYSMHPNSINKVKHRVRARMLAEIAHLREELE
jgi:Mor family transcriptional regulator